MLIALVAILAFLLAFLLIAKVVSLLIGLVFLLLVAVLCGAIAEKLLHYEGGGIVTTAGVGLIGSVVGLVIAKILHLPTWPHIAHLPVVWTVVGSLVLVAGMKVIAPPAAHNRIHGPRNVTRW